MERINDFLEWISRERAALAGLSAEAQATPAYHSGISVQVIDELVAAADQARATIQLELENVQRESARLTGNGASYNAEGTVDYLLGTANEWDGRSIGNRPPDGYRVRIQNALLAYKGARARLTQFNLQ
jgi:hypothetical protein